MPQTLDALAELIAVVARLRDPEGGCPWDLEQTHASLVPYVLEEAHEVADAIRHGDDRHLAEELGDLLLQVVLHAQIAAEEQRFGPAARWCWCTTPGAPCPVAAATSAWMPARPSEPTSMAAVMWPVSAANRWPGRWSCSVSRC